MQKVIVVTGLSGAGKSTVSKALEDLGYVVVDNVPVDLPNHKSAGALRGKESRAVSGCGC